MMSASSRSKLPNLSRLIGKAGSGQTNNSVKAEQHFGDGVAAKHSVKPAITTSADSPIRAVNP